MAYPAKGPPAVNWANWNAMVDIANKISASEWDAIIAILNGVTGPGVFETGYDYIIRKTVDSKYEAVTGRGVSAFGGTDDTNGVDGDDAQAVIQAVLDEAATHDLAVRFSKHEFPLDAMLTYTPTGSHTLSLYGAGKGFGSSTLYREGVTASPLFYTSDSAATNFQLNIDGLNFKTDAEDFTAPAIFINQSCTLNFRNFLISTDTLGADVPGVGSVGLQLGTNANTLSSDMKVIDDLWVIGYAIGVSIAADWANLRDVIIFQSNNAAFKFEGSPLKPKMYRCHTFACGGPYLIYDNRNAGTQAYVLDIDNFYAEGEPPGGFEAITAEYYQAQENRMAVQNFAAYSAYETAVPPEYAGTKGVMHNSIQSGSGSVLMPTDVADWNRNTWSSTPDPMLIATSYRNINMATMRVAVDIELAAASGADSYAILGMYQTTPAGGGVYTPFYVQCRSENGMASKLRVPLVLEVPPGWWFFVNANLQSFVKGYTITYKDYEP